MVGKIVQKWMKEEQDKHFCQCGCGRKIIVKWWHKHQHHIPRFLVGHASKIQPSGKSAYAYGNKFYRSKEQIRKMVCSHRKNNSVWMTNETKEKISKSNLKRFKDGSRAVSGGNSYSKGGYYVTPLQDKLWLRSSYELAFAKYLDAHQILWMYEMETFDLGNTTYTPDFFIPKEELFVEIKGWMKPESQLKIDIFRDQYPWIELEILFGDILKEMGVDI